MKLTRQSVLAGATLVIGGMLGASALVAMAQVPGWNPPKQTPPNGNVAAPINVGYGLASFGTLLNGKGQEKTDSFAVDGYLFAPNLVVPGATTPGQVLVASDTNGTVTWGNQSSGGSQGGGSCDEVPMNLTSGTVYQNTTGTKLIVTGYGNKIGAGDMNNNVVGSIGPTSNGLVNVASNHPDLANGYIYGNSVSFVVPPGYYYRVTNANVSAQAWQICEGQSSSGGLAFGVWNDINNDGVADTISSNTTYQAVTDGIVVAYGTSGGALSISGYSGSTLVSQVSTTESGNVSMPMTFPVKKGDSWKVAVGSGSTAVVKWIPFI